MGNTPIIQSGCHGYFIGRLDLTFSGHKMVDVRHELVCVDESIKPDAEMARRVQEVVVPHRNYLEEVVG